MKEEIDVKMRLNSENTPLISDDERVRRKEAVDFARGSVRFEGFHLSPEAEDLNMRFVAGKITISEHVQMTRVLCGLPAEPAIPAPPDFALTRSGE